MEGEREPDGGGGEGAHPWKAATARRKAWALSRDSWQLSESQDEDAGGRPFPESRREKASPAEEPESNKITSWLKECRTPHGAFLDEQGNTTTRGVLKNGCSFEDDLSLGAEANQLQPSGAKAEPSCFEKRSHFQQRGMSVTSSGSGRSNTTVSSVSELLDLYEEDPEETLYNLGFGTEEPDIASKIPSRFFGSSSSAKGIDIKVYLSAQLQRMELENPSCALTSRFRQIKVLTTVANAFSSLYSQVSGQPVQMIGESEPSEEPPPLKKTNSARNVAKILKKTLTRHNLQAAGNGVGTPNASAVSSDPGAATGSDSGSKGHAGDSQELKNEQKQPKLLRKKESCLATVTEEAHLSEPVGSGPPGKEGAADQVNGGLDHEEVGPCAPSEGPGASGEDALSADEHRAAAVPNADKDFLAQRPNPRIALLLTQTKDSFEMEEVQSIEGEAPLGTHGAGSEHLLRMASQQSDSSGFAEDPSADSCAASLKVQESSDSCDSEHTITSPTCDLNVLLDHPAFERLLGSKEVLLADVPRVVDSVDADALSEDRIEAQSSTEGPGCVLQPLSKSGDEGSVETFSESGPTSESGVPAELRSPSSAEHDSVKEPGRTTDSPDGPHSCDRVRGALLGVQQKASSLCEEQDALVSRESLSCRQRFSLRRSSSLPSTLLSPCRVVSSVKIQICPGAVRQCSPPTFTYSYTPEQEDETESAAEECEDEERHQVRSSSPAVKHASLEMPLPRMPQQAEEQPDRAAPYPLPVPPYLSGSSCSLHSAPGDWPERPLGEHSRSWSTYSVPNLHRLGAPCGFHNAPCGVPTLHRLGGPRGLHGAPWSTPSNAPFGSPHSASCHNLHSAPCSLSCNCPHGAINTSSHSSPYRSPYGVPPIAPYHHLHGSPCSPAFSDPLSIPYSAHPYPYPYPYPSSPLPTPPRSAHSVSSTEMQLRRVLHDIRNTVQNLAQCSSLASDGFSSPAFNQQGPVLSLYESTFQELQDVQRSLNLFRTQMMDLELALVRQQSTLYQNLSDGERQEAQVLQQLRSAVRQELQELELQLEDRLLSLEEQLRSSRSASAYRHHAGLHRARSSDSLSSASSLSAAEPALEILREHAGHEGRPSAACSTASGFSSRSGSPARALRSRGAARERGSHTPERYGSSKAGVYRASVSLTPTPPPRPGVAPVSAGVQPPPREEADPGEQGARGRAVSPHLRQLIEQVKESIADEVRQEILGEILAAVAPCRSAASAREPVA
ncbi:protein ITPRID2 [Scleropages formosus]|uniref:protein ITPRID2 n=1 Tax=Scleropages formosus TaxID=113540 RepID=UPI0010FAAE32|nr:protein ITPRID2 [Scleropages formosus]XP_029103024.1 protein ITPRID2 [Scleropages formosus]XP_029103025.1 protein ITPRID2 [Scleropages formosus]XP_029103026.1 protein ITPRID2 [Scleropages formosus]XP_029103027.1 protein ITPRID2 [Scleropages formosus]